VPKDVVDLRAVNISGGRDEPKKMLSTYEKTEEERKAD
jgi:hypothetical protein